MATERWEEYSWFSRRQQKIGERERMSESEREKARPASVCGRGRGLVERKIKPTQGSSYVTVHITDVPTDTQCGLWAEACGEPVWLEIDFFFFFFCLSSFFGLCVPAL